MATSTLTVHQRAVYSNVVKKAVMAVTGLVLIAFLLMHMFGNLKMFINAEAYNHYAEWLKTDLLYPVVPHGWFIWIFRAFLVACLVLHLYSAYKLWRASVHGRGGKYVHVTRREQTYAAATMRVGGILLFLLLVFHLLMFTTRTVTFGFFTGTSMAAGGTDAYTMFVNSFQHWWLVLLYAAFMLVVCMHVRHGFWSAFTTLGANVSDRARLVLNCLAYFTAVLLFVGFMLPPVAVLFGMVR